MDGLQHQIHQLASPSYHPSMTHYEYLIGQCVAKRDFRAAVYVFDKILEGGVTPSEKVYLTLEKLHSKTLPESSTLAIPSEGLGQRKLAPRRRIHKIIKGWRQRKTNLVVKEYLTQARTFLDKNPQHKTLPRLSLARKLGKACQVDFETARRLVTKLKQTGYITNNQTACTSTFDWEKCQDTSPNNTTRVNNVAASLATTSSLQTQGLRQSRLDTFFR